MLRNANKISYPFKLGLFPFNFLKKYLRSLLCRDFLTRERKKYLRLKWVPYSISIPYKNTQNSNQSVLDYSYEEL